MQSYCNLINAKDREREKEKERRPFLIQQERGEAIPGPISRALVRCLCASSDGLPTQFLAQSISPPPPFEVIRFTKKNCEHGGTTSRNFHSCFLFKAIE